MSTEQGQQDSTFTDTRALARSISVRVHPSVTKDLRDLGYTDVEYESDLPREIVATYVGFKPETAEILHRYGIRVVKHSTYDYCGVRKPGYIPCSFPR